MGDPEISQARGFGTDALSGCHTDQRDVILKGVKPERGGFRQRASHEVAGSVVGPFRSAIPPSR